MLVVVFTTPVCATLLLGGADWALTDALRVSWYGEWIAWPMLVAAAASLLWVPRRVRLVEILACAGLMALGVATLILWTGGARWDFLSLRSAVPSAWIGLTLLASASIRGLRRVSNRAHGVLGLAAALIAGLLLQTALMQRDRSALEKRMADSSRPVDAGKRASGRAGPDVLWIVVDTLRADALGVYRDLERSAAGSGRSGPPDDPPRTPFLDRLASRGLVFERVRSTAPWTLPSMMSAFTSRWPSSLDPSGRGRARTVHDLIALDPAIPTFVDVLRDAGYHTAGFQKNPFLGKGSGFEGHFDVYRLVGGDPAESESGAQLVRSVLRWADVFAGRRQQGNAQSYLLYVQFMEPHIDYRPPARWLSEAARTYSGGVDGGAKDLHRRLERGIPISEADRVQLHRLYGSEVAYLDAMIERLVGGLEARGLLDAGTLVVVSADHGEQFAEHGGWEHGDLHIENVHVPMILAGAGLEAGRVRRTLSELDLGPTILAAAGFGTFGTAEGRNRLPGTTSEEPATPVSAVFTEYGERTRLELEPWILIEERDGFVRLYDGESDPGELHDVAADHPELVRAMRARIEAHHARDLRTGGSLERKVDRRTSAMLRELGYLD
jgi:arylsulfatase A-like enzyme